LKNSFTNLTGETAMTVYTRTGDEGKTSLFSGERVSKSHQRIEACGELDELNSALGVVVSMLSENAIPLKKELVGIQFVLFQAGAWISTVPGAGRDAQLAAIDRERITDLEKAINRMEGELPVLKSFVFPGGHSSAASTHVARSVCRRAERHVVALWEQGREDPDSQLPVIVIYLNRLSDYLFVLARYLNYIHQIPENLWKK